MYVERITYTDYLGTERTEDCMFNLSKPELMRLEVGKAGGFAAYVRRIQDAQDGATIMQTFEELILSAYGRVSPDGRRFEKSKAISEEFAQTPAYDELFMKLVTDAEYGAKFINNIIPKDIADEAAKNPGLTVVPTNN